MRLFEGKVLLSSGDLVAHLGCRHATSLDWKALKEGLENDSEDDPALKLLQVKGIEHELAYLARLEASGRNVARIPDKASLPDRLRMTIEAMKQGAEVVYQAALIKGAWHGFADFLVRSDVPSNLGRWSYDVADTKLSSSIKPRYAVQLSIYSDLVAAVQGVLPRRMSVALGDGEEEFLKPSDFVHYVRQAASRLEAFISDDRARNTTAPEPCAWCEMCSWKDRCKAEWEAGDHLSLVANIRRGQRDKLVGAGISTVAGLAELPGGVSVSGIGRDVLNKLRAQARLQVAVRGTSDRLFEFLPELEGRGFARLPPPAEGDLFFDMEGDPLIPGGLEYLFGVWRGTKDDGVFHAFWGHDRQGERQAFVDFLDFVADHLTRHPDAHIYHYNHYEVTAVRRLAMQHGVGETVVDDLLRRHKFVDLLKVVREGLLVSEPSYSLKNIEHFYLPPRDGEVATAGDSIVAYETWRVNGEQSILDEIRDYNEVDCRSTAGLRDWLLSIRPAGISWFDPASVAPDAEALERQRQAEAERGEIERALLSGVSDDELPFRRLVVDLVEFHRREQKPSWWALFDRQGKDVDELIDDAACLGGLELVGQPIPVKQSLLYTYKFPPQETKISKGDRPLEVHTVVAVGSVEEIDTRNGTIVLKKGIRSGGLPNALSLGPEKPREDKVLREAIQRFADSVAQRADAFPAVEALLKRDAPRFRGRSPGQPLVASSAGLLADAISAVADMDYTWLFVQGPPGSGKTWTSSRVIVELMRRGKRVGVSSNSHKVINNLLAGIEVAAAEAGWAFRGYKKSNEDNQDTQFDGAMVTNVTDYAEIPDSAPLVAGTAWLFARPEYQQQFDYLFVDEAGQVSLANIVAMGTAANNIVLIGDQMQLGQPIQGTHPGESGASVLDYLLQGAATVSPDRGIFLALTWRMHPSLCGWVSQAIYEGRLEAAPSTETQTLLLSSEAHPALAPFGLRFLSVAHEGRSQGCLEEAEVVRDIWRSLIGQRWRDRFGAEHLLGADEILVVAPYNVQVNTIRDLLPDGARVGTVDKFQGQEAPVVIVSMTSSGGEDISRGIDFLFSRNRLNVAVSRARCLSLILASPRLLEVPCRTVDNMRLVDTLCHAHEWSAV